MSMVRDSSGPGLIVSDMKRNAIFQYRYQYQLYTTGTARAYNKYVTSSFAKIEEARYKIKSSSSLASL